MKRNNPSMASGGCPKHQIKTLTDIKTLFTRFIRPPVYEEETIFSLYIFRFICVIINNTKKACSHRIKMIQFDTGPQTHAIKGLSSKTRPATFKGGGCKFEQIRHSNASPARSIILSTIRRRLKLPLLLSPSISSST